MCFDVVANRFLLTFVDGLSLVCVVNKFKHFVLFHFPFLFVLLFYSVKHIHPSQTSTRSLICSRRKDKNIRLY